MRNEIYENEEEFSYFERVLKNYYHLKRKEQRLLKEAWELDVKIDDERKARGICYDKISGTYNNTDTPYICALIIEQASAEMEAKKARKEFLALDQFNKIEKRIGVLNDEQKTIVYALCKKKVSKTDCAKDLGISRQALDDRYKLMMKKMLEVE